MHRFIPALLLALMVAFVALPSASEAADAKILDTVVEKYNTAAKGWEPVLRAAAKRLFITLCVISLIFTAGYGFLRGGMGLGDFFAEFLRFGITMGFFYYLLENGPVIAKAIIDSMTTLGQTASSTYNVKLTPSDICIHGFGLIYDAVAEFGKSDYATGIMVIVIALMIALVFAVIAAQMVVLLCSSWILIYGGVFYLGFGGGNWTSEIAKNYFKTILAQAMQVFTFCLLLGIGQAEIVNLTIGLRSPKSVTVANYWWLFGLGGDPTKVVTSETLTMTGMCVALVFAVILCILVNRVPGLVAGVINGSSISAMAFSGVGGAMGSVQRAIGTATGMATGAGMMMAQASGARMALGSAYKAMQDHKANGEGSFANGGATGGLRGVGNALTDMASSLMGSYAQTRTTPGMMSSHTDGKVQQRQAEREKE
ncbi:MAG: P-type conjugative transfer protein TrbL [Planctomycetota bacterium]|jgi:P-type conjugative transfer protein TrbL|nr:P-type conjugative transfer protein TrbL [Planctomycetota bacterium]